MMMNMATTAIPALATFQIQSHNYNSTAYTTCRSRSRIRASASPHSSPISTRDQFGNQKKEYGVSTSPRRPPPKLEQQVPTPPPPEEMEEIFKSLEVWARENMLVHLKPVEKCWQPQDFLPQPHQEGFYEQVKELKERSKELPDEYFVVLVGGMITEEAIPTYHSILNTMDGVRDKTGASPNPWAIWIRAWSAEENRHGDLLSKYLYLSGRVDMQLIEKTIHYLIASGMNVGFEQSPHNGFIYTSFQERATFISHGNTARLAKKYGDVKLAQICGTIAADEKRHEAAYVKVVEKLFEIDPENTMLALARMMRRKIVMPAHFMYDGKEEELFDHYSAVAQRIGVYTVEDYADVLDFLVARWKLGELSHGLSGEGRRARDFVCGLSPRIRMLAERAESRAQKLQSPPMMRPFSWVFDREVQI